MRKGTKIALFIGLGILIAGVLVCVAAFALNGFSTRNLFSGRDGSKGTYNMVVKEFTEDFSDIEISVTSADVTVLKSEDAAARIEYISNAEDPEYEAVVENNTLIFRTLDTGDGSDWSDPSQLWKQFESLVSSGSISEKKLDLYLPEKAYQKLMITSASGEIHSELPFSFREVSLSTASGDMRISGMKDTESVNFATASGDIRVSGMEIRSGFHLASASGDISLDQITGGGNMKIASTSGEILLKQSAAKDTSLETVSGEICFEDFSSETLNAKTVSGDITGRIAPDTHIEAKSVSGEIQVPNGNRGKWTLETTSGDIALTS